MLTRYEYQGSPHIVELHPGRYLLECYGAQGGTAIINNQRFFHGGKGAYASGILDLKKTTTFFLYIGSQGEDGTNSFDSVAKGGWNGGGDSGKDAYSSGDPGPDTPGAGGGATDIRLVVAPEGEEATNEESLNSRIIVAAGGSGSNFIAYGAPAGDLTGLIVTADNSETYAQQDLSASSKGQGARGTDSSNVPASGAGGGYFGGITGQVNTNSFNAVSSSGSSYVSGFPGCEEFTHELGRVFGYRLSHPHISNGLNTFPSFAQDETKLYETGHEGNGAIKITRLKTCSVCACRKSNILVYVAIIIINTSTE